MPQSHMNPLVKVRAILSRLEFSKRENEIMMLCFNHFTEDEKMILALHAFEYLHNTIPDSWVEDWIEPKEN